jgi:hypothetical protein
MGYALPRRENESVQAGLAVRDSMALDYLSIPGMLTHSLINRLLKLTVYPSNINRC